LKSSDLLSVETHFAFGKNWLDYASKIDWQRIAQAEDDLIRLNNGQRFDGKTFLDIGCGSGLHALAAIRLGAKSVLCIDIDPDSVAATNKTLAEFAKGTPTIVEVISVFDLDPVALGRFDIVYSWGVLHHTGDMYRAIACAAEMVAPGGDFIIALYKKTPFCGIWRGIKKAYSSAPPTTQRRMMALYLWIKHGFWRLRNFELWFRGKPRLDLKKHIAEYGTRRGMDYYNDAHDWLGGYPYESITPDQCFSFFTKLGFESVYSNIQPQSRLNGLFGSGCDEYAFRRIGVCVAAQVDV
jgi:SAM-dependent methyltransferase